MRIGQTNVFNSRRGYLNGQQDILEERRVQIEKQIEATDAQLTAERRKSELIDQEQKVVVDLVDRGLDKLPRLLALQRTAAEMEGNKGNFEAKIAQSKQQISELKAQFVDTKNKMMSEFVAQLRDAEVKIAEYEQRMRAAQDSIKPG